MNRDTIKTQLLDIFHRQFEIENPDLDDDLRERYEFDSIDAIELLREIEILLDTTLSADNLVALRAGERTTGNGHLAECSACRTEAGISYQVCQLFQFEAGAFAVFVCA